MKATRDGYTVGIALEPFDGENSTTTATIEVSPPAGGETSRTVKTGKILVFVNLGYSKLDSVITNLETASPSGDAVSKFWSVDQTTGKVTASFTAGLDLKGNSLENVSKILSSNGSWSIDENGNLVANKITAKEIEIKEKIKFGTPESPQGITIYDEDTKEPYCIKVKSGVSVTIAGECGK